MEMIGKAAIWVRCAYGSMLFLFRVHCLVEENFLPPISQTGDEWGAPAACGGMQFTRCQFTRCQFARCQFAGFQLDCRPRVPGGFFSIFHRVGTTFYATAVLNFQRSTSNFQR